MDTAIGPSLIGISYRSGAKLVRLTAPGDWEYAVRSGELLATTDVAVERGAITHAAKAGAVPELAPFFKMPKPTLIHAA